MHGVHPYPVTTPLLGCGLGQAGDAELRCRVHGMVCEALQSGYRADVHDRTRQLGLDHGLGHGAHSQERASEVDVGHLLEIFDRGCKQLLHQVYTCIVDQDVDAAMVGHDLVDDGLPFGLVSDIEVVIAGTVDLASCFGSQVIEYIGQYNHGSLGSEKSTVFGTHASGTAGD